MTGRGHIIANAALMTTAVDAFGVRGGGSTWAPAIVNWFLGGGLDHGVAFVFGLLFFALGTLLPDADQPNSTIGRRFHIPVEHRTWTHTIWPPAILFALAALFPHLRLLAWLALGIVGHLWVDSMSVCGINWTYPYPGYVTYPSGAVVKRGRHVFKLYHSGTMSENVVLVVMVAIALLVVFA